MVTKAIRKGIATPAICYICKERHWSINAILSSDKNIFEEINSDPWGRRRNPVDWSYNNVPAAQITDRGFTGHEHLDDFGLINMNGRLYDPVIARFLNADPVIQNISSSQNYNQYSYCVNNPLQYLDPSGYNYLQSMKDAYNGIGRFYYRGGIYQIGEDGGWEFYNSRLGGGYARGTDLSYAARHSDPYHIDSQGTLRDKNGYIVVYSYQREDDEYGHWESEVVDYSGAGTHPVFKNGKLQWVDIDCVGVIQKWVWDTPSFGGYIPVRDAEWWAKASGKCEIDNSEYLFLGAFQLLRSAGLKILSSLAAKSGAKVATELPYSTQQIWKKFGEHYAEYGMTHSAENMQSYLTMAQEIYLNPAISYTFPEGGYYAGETWLFGNGSILRLDQTGFSRSLYSIKY